MDITNSEKIYKTTLSQRNAAYRYAFFNREKCNELFNNYHKKMKHIEKLKLKK